MIAYADNCQCKNPPEDDGDTTCWVHHNCFDGTCTHMDGDTTCWVHHNCFDGTCTHMDGDDYPEREQDCE